jgi:hypothetical protein
MRLVSALPPSSGLSKRHTIKQHRAIMLLGSSARDILLYFTFGKNSTSITILYKLYLLNITPKFCTIAMSFLLFLIYKHFMHYVPQHQI